MTEIAFPKQKRIRVAGEEYKSFATSVFNRDGWKCRCCGERKGLTVHHLVKRSQLGSDVFGNVISLCVFCHELVERHELDIEVTDVVVRFERKEGSCG